MAKKNSGSTFQGRPIFASGNTVVKPSSPAMSPSNISGDVGLSSRDRMLRAMQPSQQKEEPFSMTQSFEKFIGKGQPTSIGGGGGFQGMGELEAASMRLADAASKRGLAEKQSEAELEARMKGYGGIEDMMKSMRRQRRRSQYQY